MSNNVDNPESLKYKKQRQTVVAELGRLALLERSLRHLQDKIVERVASTLGVDHCLIFKLAPDHGNVIISAGFGFDMESLGNHTWPIADNGLLRVALHTSQPVVIHDFTADENHMVPEPFAALQSVNCTLTVIPGKNIPWGLISVSARQGHTYNDDDIIFLQSIANILAEVFERQAIDDDIRESEAKFRGLLESAPDGMVIVDENGNIEIVNKEFEKLTGYSSKDVIGQQVEILIPERYSMHVHYRRKFTEAPFAHRMGDNRDLFIKRKDGTEVPVEISLSPLIRKDGIFVTAAIRDITDRKRYETMLKESEQKYHILYDKSPDMHLSILPWTGEIRICNQTLSDTLGIAKEEIIGRSVVEFYHPDCRSRMHDMDEQFLQTGLLNNIHMQLLARDNRTIDVSVSASAVRDGHGKIMYSSTIWRDITELKRSEDERNRLEKELFRSQKLDAIGQLTGGIAHDFNNILAGIMGYARLALRRCEGSHDDKTKEYLHQIKHGSERARDLIEQILAYSRTIPTASSQISLSPAVEHTLKLIRPTLPSSIDIQVRSQTDLPDLIIDPTRLEQIIMNLCINARDAINGKGQININLKMSKLHQHQCDSCHGVFAGEYIQISVSDTGSGMTREVKQRIFDPFYTSKETGKGTGMGLSMVHGIVHDFEGHICVDTSPGAGTSFYIYFPYHKTLKAVIPVSAIETDEPGTKPAKQAKIMVVDDEEAIGKYLGELLIGFGYDVVTSKSSESALNLIRKQPDYFDLLLTDQTMPGLTGMELAKGVLNSRSDMPVIIMTGYSDQVSEHSASAAGIHAFMKKPIDENLLLNKIDTLLNEKPRTIN